MPTFRHGKSTVVLVDGHDLSGYLNEASVSREVEAAETTTFGNQAKTYIVGLSDGTISASGLFEASTASGSDPVLESVLESETVVLTVLTEGNVLGRQAKLAKVKETSYEVSSPVGDVVSLSAEFQADGGVRGGDVLAAARTVSTATTTNETSVDNAAGTTNGGVGHLHVTSNAAAGTLVVKVQHSTDNNVWVDLITFATVTAGTTGGQQIKLAAGTAVNRYVRATSTTSSTGAVVFTVAFARGY